MRWKQKIMSNDETEIADIVARGWAKTKEERKIAVLDFLVSYACAIGEQSIRQQRIESINQSDFRRFFKLSIDQIAICIPDKGLPAQTTRIAEGGLWIIIPTIHTATKLWVVHQIIHPHFVTRSTSTLWRLEKSLRWASVVSDGKLSYFQCLYGNLLRLRRVNSWGRTLKQHTSLFSFLTSYLS